MSTSTLTATQHGLPQGEFACGDHVRHEMLASYVSHCAHCMEAGLSVLVFGFAVLTMSIGQRRR